IFVFMSVLDVQIGLIFLAFALFTLFIPRMLRRWTDENSRRRRQAFGGLGAEFLDSVQGLGTLKAFGQSKIRAAVLAERARRLYRSTMGIVAVDGVSSGATVLGTSAGATVALVWGGFRVSSGDLELSTLLVVLMLGGEVFRPLRELAALYHQGMVAMASAEGIFALLDTPVAIKGLDAPQPQPAPAPEIRFESVTFAYEGGRRHALDDLSFTLHDRETLGLVGLSGAGKSTVVWLALRFYDPQQGRVLLGDRDLRNLPLDTLREQVSVVTQDTYLFNGTVADNLRVGMPGATTQELEEAAHAANAHEFIAALPEGYGTIVGERGIKLSGGERQRIAIARALLKAAPILILDEALSSVDAENEAAIQEALDRLMAGRTTLVIAHRLSSVVGADRILVLDDGRLVESGGHGELAAANGVYSRLMADQQATVEQDSIADALDIQEAPA
ncbi:MAG: ABC transporter ATP-binding protein, partial [Candidatus Brocadiia bacterium]|nr:ABC transporter ATP-binding protein [Candidatus Brocadiia bacterium]